MSAKDAGLFPALKLDEFGRCPNCLIKPIPYRADCKWFCHRCCRDYDMLTEQQRESWAWKSVGDGHFKPTRPDSDYVHAEPTKATKRAAARTDVQRR